MFPIITNLAQPNRSDRTSATEKLDPSCASEYLTTAPPILALDILKRRSFLQKKSTGLLIIFMQRTISMKKNKFQVGWFVDSLAVLLLKRNTTWKLLETSSYSMDHPIIQPLLHLGFFRAKLERHFGRNALQWPCRDMQSKIGLPRCVSMVLSKKKSRRNIRRRGKFFHATNNLFCRWNMVFHPIKTS